jgi:UDP-glucose 4-epimerase
MIREMLWVVTGGAGYIGSHVTSELLKSGYQVVVFDDLSTGLREFVPMHATFVEGSILSKSDIDACMKVVNNFELDFGVIHIAGVKLPGESMVYPEKYWRINTLGTLEFADAAIKNGACSIVFSSSCSVYGNVADRAVNESQATSPKSTYAKSKLQAESILFDLSSSHDISVAVLRYFNVVGTDNNKIYDRSKENLFPAILDAISGVSELKIHGNRHETHDGTCIRDYLHVGDLAKAHVLAAEWIVSQDSGFEVFNFGSGLGASVLEVVSEFEHQSKGPVPFTVGPNRAGDPASITADSTKAEAVLGWHATRTLSEIVASLLNEESK